MFKLNIQEEDKFEQATIDTVEIFESTLDLIEKRMSLLADLSDFKSNTLTMCRKLITKALMVARNGEFDDVKLSDSIEFLENKYKLIESTTNDLNILAQIERMYDDLEIIYKESEKVEQSRKKKIEN